ncbi:MAG TPA: helix-turn-helix domain-containing protein [Sunxiuqinia sp.]|nr:helix-turn-helix domain-containing protein [Sunxiuqinia sp.]
MTNPELAKRIKELRNRKGISQELLAENTGLSLRTIQRIENGKTAPRGDTLNRLAEALNATPDDLTDWAVQEDTGFLAAVSLSALGFILFPLLGVLLPLILWISKKGKIKRINQVGKDVINFQLSWAILVLGTYLFFLGRTYYRIQHAGDISPSLVGNPVIIYAIFGFLYSYNLILVIVNTIKITNGNDVNYLPKIRFIR